MTAFTSLPQMTYQGAIAGFDLPQADVASPLHRILAAALPQNHSSQGLAPLAMSAWNAAHFHLDRVQIFREATESEQAAILAIANQNLLHEAYWIEQAGVGYMAKMVLLAETQEERMLYGLFAADETQHLAQIRQFLPNPPTASNAPFLSLLADLVESSDKTVMQFVLQVVLEGWGLTHYRQLAQTCQHPGLQSCFQGFIQAEARHHATGVTLFNQAELSAASQTAILEILSQFLRMIQAGPQCVVEAIAQVKGHLSRHQKIQILTELDTVRHSGSRLQTLRHLMQTPQTMTLIETLSDRGCFNSLPAHLCV